MGTVTKIDGFAGNNELNQRFVRLYAAVAITKGDAVAIAVDTTTYGAGNHVKKAISSDANFKHAIGVAAETISSGDIGVIQVGGLCTFALIDTSECSAGSLLSCSATSGALQNHDSSEEVDSVPCALLVTLSGTDTATNTVWLLNPFNL
jgi:predicted RecA/RadA family phage recombinase